MRCRVIAQPLLLLLCHFFIAHSVSVVRKSMRSSLSDTSCPTPRLKNGRIRARGRGRIIRYSCYSDYELVGNRYSTCIRGSWDTPTPICVSSRCPAAPTPKHAVVGEKYHGGILMYFCEPGYVLVGNAEIYCDGRQWNGSTPYCRDSNAIAPTSCDFEKEGLCWWEQDPKHDFDWIKHRFDTPSSHIGTGPTHDHTLGPGSDGYYLYVEATGRLVNDTARIISPLYNSNLTESGCFSFWYHMYGATIGSLNVYFKSEFDTTPRLMWSKSGNQGNQWRRGIFDLPNVNTSFQITIEGVRGASYVSDIAIDDLAILQGDECVVKNVTVNSTPVPDGDEVEVFNAMQSCRDRCVNTTIADTTPNSEFYSNPDVCQCTLDCADTSSCCPDFAEYCLYEMPDQTEITLSSTTVVPPTRPPTTKEPTIPTTSFNATTENQNEITSSTIATTGKSEKSTEPSIATSTVTLPLITITHTTTTTTTTTTTEKPETTTRTKITSKKLTSTSPPIEHTTTTTTTTPTTTTYTTLRATINAETPFLPPISETTPYLVDAVQAYTESNELIVQDARQLKKSTALNISGIIGIVIGILSGLAIIAIASLFIYRRRKFYTRSSDGSAYSEDCTVGFLASVETLDFSLARPSDDEDDDAATCDQKM